MLTKEEREAAERLLVPIGADDYPEVELEFLETCRYGDGTTVAEAMLREYLPGDELPFTDEWFVEVTANCEGRKPLLLASLKTDQRWISYFPMDDEFEFRLLVPSNSTRGDVRRFSAWQGIALKTP